MAVTLRKFFPWVWMAIVVLFLSGYSLVPVFGGFALLPLHVHIMHLLAWVMTAIFAVLFFLPNKKFRQAVSDGDTAAAGAALGRVRLLVTLNLVLGLVVVAVAASGRYWS